MSRVSIPIQLYRITVAVENFGPMNLQPILVGLRSYNVIKHFNFYNAGLGDEGLLLLVGFIQNNPMVESLDIIDNITPLGCGFVNFSFYLF